ncbi:hypothetical protein BX661DRAFT_69146 [Kickxella alabastrina]|uniref:uncharacterized protein n=1 Tax=Kickxella alabastrina TaxID=61397 RepID=UPI0022204100|nr:uncharacterized protein BX661DRAFT_69146 [Kickxella alabastrina]KAI7820875.1 hypothetical protein BX661DRAFT_69146 [Kickxella alabastrina]
MGGTSTRITQTLLILVMIVSLGCPRWLVRWPTMMVQNTFHAIFILLSLLLGFCLFGRRLCWLELLWLWTVQQEAVRLCFIANVMPLILVVGVMTVLNAPLTYNFQLTSNWKWVS